MLRLRHVVIIGLFLLVYCGTTLGQDEEEDPLEIMVEIIEQSPEICDDYGEPDWELIPVEDCDEQTTCNAPESICRYNFLEDQFSCYELNEDCESLVRDLVFVTTTEAPIEQETTSPSTSTTTTTTTTEAPVTTPEPTTTEEAETTTTERETTTTEKEFESTAIPETTIETEEPTETTIRTTEATTAEPATTTKASTKKTGARDWHAFCCWWAAGGECNKNPVFMRTVCQKSCGTYKCRAESALSCKVKVDTEGCQWLKLASRPIDQLITIITTTRRPQYPRYEKPRYTKPKQPYKFRRAKLKKKRKAKMGALLRTGRGGVNYRHKARHLKLLKEHLSRTGIRFKVRRAKLRRLA